MEVVTVYSSIEVMARPGSVTHAARSAMAEHYRNGASSTDIAAAFGVSPATVLYQLRQAGVTLRTSGMTRRQQRRGGRYLENGYIVIRVEEDDGVLRPMAREASGRYYVLEHRAVMARKLGRPLTPSETVHHMNGDKTDNRIENLQLRQGRHGRGIVACCNKCGSHDIAMEEL